MDSREGLGITISGREMKELEIRGPPNPRVGKRFQGRGHRIELGGEGTSWVAVLYLKRGTVHKSSSEGWGNRGDLESGAAPLVLE